MQVTEAADTLIQEIERIRKSRGNQKLATAMSEALGCMDKANAKKIVRGTNAGVYCPRCGGANVYYNDVLNNYCPDCGQKIKHAWVRA